MRRGVAEKRRGSRVGARGAHLRQMSLQSFLKDLLLLFGVCAVYSFFLCVFVLFGQVVVIVDGRVGGFRAGQTVNTHTHRVGTR